MIYRISSSLLFAMLLVAQLHALRINTSYGVGELSIDSTYYHIVATIDGGTHVNALDEIVSEAYSAGKVASIPAIILNHCVKSYPLQTVRGYRDTIRSYLNSIATITRTSVNTVVVNSISGDIDLIEFHDTTRATNDTIYVWCYLPGKTCTHNYLDGSIIISARCGNEDCAINRASRMLQDKGASRAAMQTSQMTTLQSGIAEGLLPLRFAIPCQTYSRKITILSGVQPSFAINSAMIAAAERWSNIQSSVAKLGNGRSGLYQYCLYQLDSTLGLSSGQLADVCLQPLRSPTFRAIPFYKEVNDYSIDKNDVWTTIKATRSYSSSISSIPKLRAKDKEMLRIAYAGRFGNDFSVCENEYQSAKKKLEQRNIVDSLIAAATNHLQGLIDLYSKFSGRHALSGSSDSLISSNVSVTSQDTVIEHCIDIRKIEGWCPEYAAKSDVQTSFSELVSSIERIRGRKSRERVCESDRVTDKQSFVATINAICALIDKVETDLKEVTRVDSDLSTSVPEELLGALELLRRKNFVDSVRYQTLRRYAFGPQDYQDVLLAFWYRKNGDSWESGGGTLLEKLEDILEDLVDYIGPENRRNDLEFVRSENGYERRLLRDLIHSAYVASNSAEMNDIDDDEEYHDFRLEQVVGSSGAKNLVDYIRNYRIRFAKSPLLVARPLVDVVAEDDVVRLKSLGRDLRKRVDSLYNAIRYVVEFFEHKNHEKIIYEIESNSKRSGTSVDSNIISNHEVNYLHYEPANTETDQEYGQLLNRGSYNFNTLLDYYNQAYLINDLVSNGNLSITIKPVPPLLTNIISSEISLIEGDMKEYRLSRGKLRTYKPNSNVAVEVVNAVFLAMYPSTFRIRIYCDNAQANACREMLTSTYEICSRGPSFHYNYRTSYLEDPYPESNRRFIFEFLTNRQTGIDEVYRVDQVLPFR